MGKIKGAGLVRRLDRFFENPRRLEMLPMYFFEVIFAAEVLPTPSETGDRAFFIFEASKIPSQRRF